MKDKIVVGFFIFMSLILISFFLQYFIVGVSQIFNRPSYKGIIINVKDLETGVIPEVIYKRNIYILSKKNQYWGEYNKKKHTEINIGDSVVFRRTTFIDRVRVIEKNGVKINSYYGGLDLVSLIVVVFFTFAGFYLPKFYRKNGR